MEKTRLGSFADMVEYARDLGERHSNLRADRIELALKAMLESYEGATLPRRVWEPVEPCDADAARDLQTIVLWASVRLDQFNAPDFYWQNYFAAVGRAVANGEQKYLQDVMAGAAEVFGVKVRGYDGDFAALQKAAQELRLRGHRPDLLLAPVQHMTELVLGWRDKFDLSKHPDTVSLEGSHVRVVWSHGRAPMRDFVLIDSNVANWCSPRVPGQSGFLVTGLGASPSTPNSVEYLAATSCSLRIVDRSGLCRVLVEDREGD